ncbi:MAG: methylated-DNA--[protein]-cysteine S-methyltransferase [Geobacteraceae bacterium]|jgi:AraC family transcriptional regulator of adaptative response/methylated-DNA-[protein]-cysteine methyltransferase
MLICFSVVQTSYLGWVLVAATGNGICSLSLGENPDILREELRMRFPQAEFREGDPAISEMVSQVLSFVEAPRSGHNLPLDIRGSTFQQRVWLALREIPAGSTVSYRELAEQIGRPQAVRAVATACAANPVAVLVPCHRVVRSDGNLAGYRWGLERKRALLAREAGEKNGN